MAVLTLADAKTHLNITTLAHDAELSSVIPAAEAAIAQRVGPLEPTSVTARLSGTTGLVLPVYPLISLTSVANSAGTALAVADFTVDPATGVLEYVSGSHFTSPYYTVTYQAGRAVGALPADLTIAVKELTRHLWESQRSPARFPGSTISEGPVASPGAAYLLPYRVQELIAPHVQYGFA